MIGVPAALGNAIADAINVDIFDLPITSEKVWTEIQKQKPEIITTLKEKLMEEEE